jgi:hypothetical protein
VPPLLVDASALSGGICRGASIGSFVSEPPEEAASSFTMISKVNVSMKWFAPYLYASLFDHGFDVRRDVRHDVVKKRLISSKSP